VPNDFGTVVLQYLQNEMLKLELSATIHSFLAGKHMRSTMVISEMFYIWRSYCYIMSISGCVVVVSYGSTVKHIFRMHQIFTNFRVG